MMRSRTVELDVPVHYLDYDGPPDGPTYVLLHALAAHHATWVALAPLLARTGRVLVPDLAGFGMTPLGARRATLDANRELLDAFITAVPGDPVVLVGNSMGGGIALLQAWRRPASVEALVLVAPAMAMLRPYLVEPQLMGVFLATLAPNRLLRGAERFARGLSPQRFVDEMIRICAVDPTRVPPEVVEAAIAVATERMGGMPWKIAAFQQSARSVLRFAMRPDRFLRIVREVATPTLLLLGEHDRLVPARVAEIVVRTRPDWRSIVLPGAGHMPQIEHPVAVARAMEDWLAAGWRRVRSPA